MTKRVHSFTRIQCKSGWNFSDASLFYISHLSGDPEPINRSINRPTISLFLFHTFISIEWGFSRRTRQREGHTLWHADAGEEGGDAYQHDGSPAAVRNWQWWVVKEWRSEFCLRLLWLPSLPRYARLFAAVLAHGDRGADARNENGACGKGVPGLGLS